MRRQADGGLGADGVVADRQRPTARVDPHGRLLVLPCVLLPDVVAAAAVSSTASSSAAVEMAPALADRLFRAASGRSARLAADGTRLEVDSGEQGGA